MAEIEIRRVKGIAAIETVYLERHFAPWFCAADLTDSSGRVYAFTDWERKAGLDIFRRVPVWDAPVLIAEKALIP